jgi:hypothetical protein
MTAVLFILFYLWCCYMAFGYAYADFRTDCPFLKGGQR